MLQLGIRSTVKPSAVLVEEYGSEKHVYLHRNIRTETDEDGQEMYVYDAASFQMEPDRTETAKEIEEDLELWWEYASQEEEEAPTLKERVELIEAMLMEF